MDFELDDAQRAIADTVAAFCREHCPDAVVKGAEGRLPSGPWRALAELGVLALATPEGEGGAVELAAAYEALGHAVFPGPLVAACLAAQLLPAEARRALVAGEAVPAVGAPPLLPWAPLADVFIELDGGRAWRARPRGAIEPVATLGGEPWGRVALEREDELSGVARALSLEGIARAAYLAAAGGRLVRAAAAHAATRRQFGRAIGDFQAVAHPLADALMRTDAAALLARAAAFAFDTGRDEQAELAAAARLSASAAALDAAHVAFQCFGALGMTLEGPVFHVARRIRQLASQPPLAGPAREAVLARYAL